jgi:hypothetical protein
VAEPWSNDFAALAQRSRHGLRPLGSFSTHPKETKMRFFKSHPALAALAMLLVLGLVGGAAYAVVREVWVSIDSTKSAPEIENDVNAQLQQQGVPATAHADKTDDGQLTVNIHATDPNAGSEMHFTVNGEPVQAGSLSVRIYAEGNFDATALQTLDGITSAPDMVAVLDADYPNDAALAAAIVKVFADHGFAHVDVHPNGDEIDVTVRAN